jgi:hypothetical protein
MGFLSSPLFAMQNAWNPVLLCQGSYRPGDFLRHTASKFCALRRSPFEVGAFCNSLCICYDFGGTGLRPLLECPCGFTFFCTGTPLRTILFLFCVRKIAAEAVMP